MQKTVAVIGSNSFAGSDFIDLLLSERDYRIIGVSRSPERPPLFLPYKRHGESDRFLFRSIDLAARPAELLELLAAEKPAWVVNFAAETEVVPSFDCPERYFETNALALAALVNGLRRAGTIERYAHLSTPAVYGPWDGPVREGAAFNPITPYAASRAAADMMVATQVINFAFPAILIRPCNLYGAHQPLQKIVPHTFSSLKLRRPVELHGGGAAMRSYLHVRDASRGVLAALERGQIAQVYHLAPTDAGISIRELVRRICDLLRRDFKASVRPVAERIGQEPSLVLDSSKAREELGWEPAIPLDVGLAEVARWIDAWWEDIRRLHRI